jgi:hypothetical protein
MEDDSEEKGEDIETLLEYSVGLVVTVVCTRPIQPPGSEQPDEDQSDNEAKEGEEKEPVPSLEELDCRFVLSMVGSEPEESKQLTFVPSVDPDAEGEAPADNSRPGTAKRSVTSSRPASSSQNLAGSSVASIADASAPTEETWSHTFTVQLSISEDAVIRLCRSAESSLSLVKAGLDVPLVLSLAATPIDTISGSIDNFGSRKKCRWGERSSPGKAARRERGKDRGDE